MLQNQVKVSNLYTPRTQKITNFEGFAIIELDWKVKVTKSKNHKHNILDSKMLRLGKQWQRGKVGFKIKTLGTIEDAQYHRAITQF